MAKTLVQARAEDSQREVGKHWASRFLERHPKLSTAWSTFLESKRAKAGKPERIEPFLSRLQGLRQEYDAALED